MNPAVDPTFSFMTVDHDGKIRMDCSSPYAMARLVGLKDNFASPSPTIPTPIATASSRPSVGLLNPNHFLAVAIDYLLAHRPNWPKTAAVGKTLVSSSLIDRVVAEHDRRLNEVPVGFKWFAPGLFDGTCCFGGEESAGASFLRLDGTVWTTDKDGPIMDFLAAEITAVTGKDPGEHVTRLTAEFGTPLLHPHRRPGHARAKSEAQKPLARSRPHRNAGRRTDRRQADARPRATTRRSAASRSPPKPAGSPPAPPAPKTSTRSTPKASRARATRPDPRRSPTNRERRPRVTAPRFGILNI